jgi:hypothetical protein
MAKAHYNEPGYRAAVANLKANPAINCWRCGFPATTIDHVPAVALHHHQAGGRCCELRPACRKCNYGGGARIAARLRRHGARSTSRVW